MDWFRTALLVLLGLAFYTLWITLVILFLISAFRAPRVGGEVPDHQHTLPDEVQS